MTWDYTAFGLNLRLPFACPNLPAAVPGACPELVVTEAPVPGELAAPVAAEGKWQAEPGRFLWCGGPRSGRFLVEAGAVTLERQAAAEPAMLAAHFLGPVLVAVLRQRGRLVLHANAVVTPDGRAVAVAAPSGTGKSTTLMALIERGCQVLSDDLAVLEVVPGQPVRVLPGLPQVHLTEAAAAALGRDISGLARHAPRRIKAVLPIPALMAAAPAPLAALFVLAVHDGADLRLRQVAGGEKFEALQEAQFGPVLGEEAAGQFAMLAAVAGGVPVYRLQRPRGRWTAFEVAEAVLGG